MKCGLRRSDFLGPSIDGRRANVSFLGQARFDGVVALTRWSREEAQRLLPIELELAPTSAHVPDSHPVLVVLGEQSQTAALLGGLTFPTGLDYHEMAFIVPYVRRRGGTYLHSFIPRMYASDSWAVWSGNSYYGFGKRLMSVGWFGSTFVASDRDGAGVAAQALVEAADAWEPCRTVTDGPRSSAIEIAELPVIGRRSDGSLVTSYFEWGYEGATERRARVNISIAAPVSPTSTATDCHACLDTAFQVQGMRWRVSWLVPCRF